MNEGEGGKLVNIDLGDTGQFAKPVNTFVKKVCKATGLLADPLLRQWNARADRNIEKKQLLHQIELTEIEQRAMQRLVHQESRKQANIESITYQAAKMLPDEAKPEALDEDWLTHFFKQCDSVSDKDMQLVWSKVLSGEANSPGSFSKRTINFLSTIDKKDAELFTSLGQFVWTFGTPEPFLYNLANPVYVSKGINATTVIHLESIGLLARDSFQGHKKEVHTNLAPATYFGTTYHLDFSNVAYETNGRPKVLMIGHVVLTNIGRELMPIAGGIPNESFRDYMIEEWRKKGISVTTFDV